MLNIKSLLATIDRIRCTEPHPIKFIVCTDGTVYNIGQGLCLDLTEEPQLSDCSELVYHLGYDHIRSRFDIYGRHKSEGNSRLRYSIPESDIVQIAYYTEEEYLAAVAERWPQLTRF